MSDNHEHDVHGTGPSESDVRPTRRTVLQSTALATAAGLGATAVSAQDGGEIELEARTSGWIGVSPDDIADERNPTLQLEAGQEYTLTWENGDGAGHNFIIEDADGEERFVDTEIMSGTGETQEVEFTADEAMAEYFCGPHPQSMRGEIEFGGGGGADDEEPVEADPEELIGDGPTVGLETVGEGLTAPLDLQAADEDRDRRFVVDQTGQIYVHGEDGIEDEPFLDVEDRMVELEGDFDERGLLGLAFHPDFSENGRFFVRYSAPPADDTPEGYDHTFVLAEFATEGDDAETADPDSEERILEIPEPQFNHNAGPIAFGPDDGYLYVATGDGGGGNDEGEGHVEDWYDENAGGNGQDTTENLLGGMLRIDVDGEGDGEGAYAIPEDNPLVDEEDHLDEYYAWGMRNPWGMSFTEDGELLAADVGQANFEEVNHVRSGGNYGWNVKEGRHCFSTDSPEEPLEECPDATPEDVRGGEPLLDPVIEYPQHPDDLVYGEDAEQEDEEDAERGEDDGEAEQIGVSVVGGYLYESDAVEELADTYVFGDWSRDGQGPGRLFLARPPEEWPEDVEGDGESFDDMFVDPSGDDGDGGNESEGQSDDGGDEDEEEYGVWPIEELSVESGDEVAEDGDLTQLVYGFGRDADGELYVLTSDTPTLEGEGYVQRIVPADGSETADGDGDEETDADEDDVDAGNETGDDADAGNETNAGNETANGTDAGNETANGTDVGNETDAGNGTDVGNGTGDGAGNVTDA